VAVTGGFTGSERRNSRQEIIEGRKTRIINSAKKRILGLK
jgi:hypothetical protein